MAKRQFRIGDLAKELKVKKFVIRFWEKEFNLKSDRSQGGQRFYTHEDLNIFLTIKDLLYNQGFTIAGAKKQLPEVLAGAKLASADSFQEMVLDSSGQTNGSEDYAEHNNEQDDQEEGEELDLVLDLHEAMGKDLNPSEVVQKIVCAKQESPETLESIELFDEKKIEIEMRTTSDQDVQACQSAQETCVPARAVPDSSFYEGLTTLKDQLMRLYELLD